MNNSEIFKEKDFLKYFFSLSPSRRKQLITKLGRSQLNSLSEIFSNVLRGNLTRGNNKGLIKTLYPFKKSIRQLALKKTSLKEKRRILASKRGGSILGILLPVLSSLVSNLLG